MPGAAAVEKRLRLVQPLSVEDATARLMSRRGPLGHSRRRRRLCWAGLAASGARNRTPVTEAMPGPDGRLPRLRRSRPRSAIARPVGHEHVCGAARLGASPPAPTIAVAARNDDKLAYGELRSCGLPASPDGLGGLSARRRG